LEDLAVDRTAVLKWIFNRKDWRAWTGFIWLRIGTGGQLSRIQELTYRLHKTQETFRLAEKLLASTQGLLDTVG
jgi:hypothetical protein